MRYLNSSLLRLEPGKLAGCSAPQSVEHLRALLDEGVGAGPFQMNLEKQQGFLFGLPFRLSNCNLFKHQGLPFGEPFTWCSTSYLPSQGTSCRLRTHIIISCMTTNIIFLPAYFLSNAWRAWPSTISLWRSSRPQLWNSLTTLSGGYSQHFHQESLS